MLHNKKIVFIVIGIILIIGITLAICYVEQSKPQNVIESKLDLELPDSSKIINYQYDSNGGYFDAKILIENNNITSVKKQLDNFFGGVTSNDFMEDIPNFKNVCSWWDMENDKIKAGYMNFIDVKKWRKIMPRQVWAFISEDKEGRYYLYISY